MSLEHFFSARINKHANKQEQQQAHIYGCMSKEHRSQLKELPIAKAGTI